MSTQEIYFNPMWDVRMTDTSLRDVVMGLGLPDRGIAVAVDGAVVPRGRWDRHTMTDGAVVEIVTAVQGG